jgi:hypothetical protein
MSALVYALMEVRRGPQRRYHGQGHERVNPEFVA